MSTHRPQFLKDEVTRVQFSAHLFGSASEYEFEAWPDYDGYLVPRGDFFPAEGTLYLTNYRLFFHGNSQQYDDTLGWFLKNNMEQL